MKEQPRTLVTHFRNSNFKHKMKRVQILQKLVHKKIYVLEIAAVFLSKNYFFTKTQRKHVNQRTTI